MPNEIIDGKGSGFRAEVTDTNELRVRATMHTEEHLVSVDRGEVFLSSVGESGLDSLSFLAAQTGDLLHLKNLGTRDIIITAIICSADAAGGIVTLAKNKVEGVISQNTPIIPVNLNFGSAKIADAQAEVWDETNGNGIQGLTNGQILRTFIMPGSPLNIATGGTIIIPQGKSITISFNNITAGTIEFECGFRFYIEEN